MGDMKTPDFDDLLAAFDIPDIDTSEALHSGQEEAEAHVKALPAEPPAPDHALPHADITTVSVIVKNTVCPEQLDLPPDGRGKDGLGLGPRLLQNGFAGPPEGPPEAAPANGECWAPKEKGKGLDLFAHFSPDPHEDGTASLIDQPRECPPREKPPLPPPPTLSATPEQGGESAGPLPPPFPPPFEASAGGMGLPPPPAIKQEKDCEGPCRGASPSGCPPPSSASYRVGSSPLAPWPGSDAALSSGAPEAKRLPASPQGGSPKREGSPGTPASPQLLGAGSLKEEPVEKPLQCPAEASSGEEVEEEEEESAGSPSSRPLKVRIKTIKTSSGSITRTVTRVSSDSEPGAAKPPSEQGEAALPPVPEKEEPPGPKPPVAAGPPKGLEGPTVVSVQLGDGTRLKGTVLPVSGVQSASSAMLMAASVAQQKAAVVLPSKAVAKNIISLVPQPLPKGPEGRAGAGQKLNGATVVVMQPQKPAAAPPAPPGTVISRSQSGLVEAFNRVLNSKNLLPAYRPNLLPPAEASLRLPPLGYRCLECGDAFALEKSLARHYDRRSMRIEVTCNHCTKRLAFFNKCSLLLHAREHKDQGLVMQCSHLVMRPIALDQMVGQPDITPLVPVAGKLAAPPAPDAVAPAPPGGGGPPELPVLPLSGGPEPPTTNSCQCLECKEHCKDKAGLAAHFQQAGAPTAATVTGVGGGGGGLPVSLWVPRKRLGERGWFAWASPPEVELRPPSVPHKRWAFRWRGVVWGSGGGGSMLKDTHRRGFFGGRTEAFGVGQTGGAALLRRGLSVPLPPPSAHAGLGPLPCLPAGVQRLPHDHAQPLQLRRPPAHAQEPPPPRLPRVRGQLPAGQLRGPPEGVLPALLPQDRLQVRRERGPGGGGLLRGGRGSPRL